MPICKLTCCSPYIQANLCFSIAIVNSAVINLDGYVSDSAHCQLWQQRVTFPRECFVLDLRVISGVPDLHQSPTKEGGQEYDQNQQGNPT
mmetsp:Transcript_122537/g.238353  ORF Transcript_122537/g.238353 Transcript_122537/m.238353 type:complete len:90 (+) Transcript_122537:817-1086(+)